MSFFFDDMGPGPIDSYDIYAMGLRPPRCNGCTLRKKRHELGNKFLMLNGAIYELDAEPLPGQGKPQEHKEHPIRFHVHGMSYEHSDECYHWTPPEKDTDVIIP